MALRMSDQRPKPACRERVDGILEAGVEGPRARLEQDPAARAAERQRTQLLIVELADPGRRDLSAGEHRDCATRIRDGAGQPSPRGGERAHNHRVISADVRGGADRADAVGLRLTRHRHRVVEVPRAVVQPRQQVAVQIDRVNAPRARSRAAATATKPPAPS